MDEEFGKVLCLAPDCDPCSLQIDPAEGFLLSRIDGRTPWRVLREMGAMPPEEADLCIEGWLARGIVVIDAEQSDRQRVERERERARRTSQAARPRSQLPTEVDSAALDDELDIDLDVQRRILEFEVGLRRSYHEILAVEREADAKQIKRAYYTLSREFHPDRYFRRNIGGYAARLDRVFKKVTEAYELLSDPTTRAEVERSMQASPAPQAPVCPEPTQIGGDAPPPPPRPMTKLELLRARMPFKIPEAVLVERQRRASEFCQAAQQAERRGSYVEATSSLRLAIAFDPFNEEYKRAFGEVQALAAEWRAKALLEQTDSLEASQLKEALRLLEDVLLYRPHDPEVNHRAAQVALELDDHTAALEYVQLAVEHCPEVASYHLTLARVHQARRERGHAIHEAEKAVKLDPSDQEARRLLASLKPHLAGAGGGMR